MKKIYQTWKTEKISDHSHLAEQSSKSFQDNHPEWDYELWTDDMLADYVQTKYPWVFPYWEKFDMHLKRVDVIRYCWLHDTGGMYADLDLLSHKPMDDLFTDEYDLYFYVSKQAKENNWTFAGNAWMYARVPGHPFWEDLLEFNCLYNATGNPHENILWHTGPRSVGKVLDFHMRKHPESKVKLLDHTIVGNNGEGEDQYAAHYRTHVWG